ncbi:TMV resistance protein N-like [Syzygium oleosum]|uniref:TMV resistance protein N-like n=1 Tax=Syzygium oleosum TaxID=219896 RepID=UPI0024BA054B|nr:TMV resistance protein N-like [Syzygium oleosum]
MASSKRIYHVFLSFRGPDVRNNFLSHLYAALDQKGIHTFVDDEELGKGEQISPTLMRAIEESRIAIIIFSEDYASSRWCLEELATIMECKAQKELIVLPVFYKVEPREVREGREAYGRAMAKHEFKFGKDSETVKRWKKALFDAGNLSGWDFNDGDEAELIQRIVKDVSSRLERRPLHVADHPVGIDSRVQEVISLSQKESDDDDVLMIGIWGLGGIGKTTIAKAIYNAIESQFQGSSFLAQVKEASNKSSGLVGLQEKLLSEILSPRHLTVNSVDGGISLIRERLCRKKVLLVLDDVDQLDQLKALAGGDWFGKGSRIFVTSRDKHLLNSHDIKCVHEVKTLDNDEALDLFVWHAFKNSKKPEIRKDLIDGALHYASGLPLALEVLGSLLYGRNEPAWESALRKLSRSLDKGIDRVLKISFDGLDDNEREIFLDIACFFKGKRIEYIKEVLDGCDLERETTIGIDILIERSLIRNEYGTLQMHDLVQLMGKKIVKQECPNNPEKRSRLWLFEDVRDILWEDTGTDAVQAIVLDLPTPEERSMSLEEITIKVDAFRNMKMLKMLILPKVHISSEGPVRLPNNLRWLKWPNAPLLEFGSKLIRIDVPKSHIRGLEGKIKHFTKLKYINFSQCKSLVSVPDFSSAPNLESLYLDRCKSLVEVHQSVAYLDNLKFLSLQFCSNLSVFPNTLKTKSLQALDLFGCSKLEKFSDVPGKLELLEELDLGRTAIKELPASLENLLSLKKLNLIKCKKLATLPSGVYKWQNLEYLNLLGCSNFITFPENLEDSNNPNGNMGFRKLKWLKLNGCNLSEVGFLKSSSSFPKLGHLDLSKNKFTHLPTCINEYKYLEHLYVDDCKQIQKIPQLPPNVHVLSANRCRSLQEFPDLSSLTSDCYSVELSSSHKFFREGANMAHALSLEGLRKMRNVDIRLIGKEMPEWFFPGEDSSIAFTVPRDLYDNFLGLARCFVLGPKGGKAVSGFAGVRIHVNDHMLTAFWKGVRSMDSDHVRMGYFPRRMLWVGRKRLRDDCCHIQVNFAPETEVELKKCGFCPICEQQEDDQRIVLQPHQPMKTNWLSERDSDEDDWIDTEEEESSSESDDELIEAIDREKEKTRTFQSRSDRAFGGKRLRGRQLDRQGGRRKLK